MPRVTKKAKAKKPIGRPSSFSQETADKICGLMIEGKSLRAICQTKGMPAKTTVMRWLAVNAEFRDQYARGAESRAEHWAEEILEIADESTADVSIDAKGNERVNNEVVARSRLRVDTRKWLMSKLAPKKYGDRQSLEHSGPDGKPIPIEHTTDESFAAVVRALETVGRTKAGATSGEGDVAKPSETGAATPAG